MSQSNWSRSHDAWIAEKCEGWVVWQGDKGVWYGHPPDQPERWRAVSSYSTDIAACIRAAEAWKVKDKGIDRTVGITLGIVNIGMPATATVAENYLHKERYLWRYYEGIAGDKDTEPSAAAIAQALYRATGGTE